MSLKINQVSSSRYAHISKTRIFLLPIIFLAGLFLPVSMGAMSVSASEANPVAVSDNPLDIQAKGDFNTVFVSSIPTGTDNIDTPLSTYATFTGTVDVATSGTSFYPDLTTNSFDVDVPERREDVSISLTRGEEEE